MTTHELIAKLHAHQKELRRMGVASLAVFGSAARGEARACSDIDLLVEFDRSAIALTKIDTPMLS